MGKVLIWLRMTLLYADQDLPSFTVFNAQWCEVVSSLTHQRILEASLCWEIVLDVGHLISSGDLWLESLPEEPYL